MLKNENENLSFIRALKTKRITTVAGAWVFFFLTALLPLLFLLITAFGVFGVSLSTSLATRLPEELRPLAQTLIQTAENSTSGITVFFVITTLFSGSALLSQMSKDGEYIYGEKHPKHGGVFRRLWAMLGLCVLFLIFMGTAVLFAFKNMIFASVQMNEKTDVLVTSVALTLIILVSFFVIVLLCKFIAPVKLKNFEAILGGFVSLFIVVMGTIGFFLYIKWFKNYNAFYGSLAGVIVFLLWAYIIMLGLVIGVTASMVVHNREKRRVGRLQSQKMENVT